MRWIDLDSVIDVDFKEILVHYDDDELIDELESRDYFVMKSEDVEPTRRVKNQTLH